MKKIIVVTGLGDNGVATELVTKGWSNLGFEPIMFVPDWDKNEGIEPKIERLIDLIDKEEKVILLGISAGASLAMNVFLQKLDKVEKVVSVCGRLRFGWSENLISKKLQEGTLNYKAFSESVKMLERNIKKLADEEKKRVLTISAELGDEYIPPQTSQLDGATNVLMPTMGHLVTITSALTNNFGIIDKFLK